MGLILEEVSGVAGPESQGSARRGPPSSSVPPGFDAHRWRCDTVAPVSGIHRHENGSGRGGLCQTGAVEDRPRGRPRPAMRASESPLLHGTVDATSGRGCGRRARMPRALLICCCGDAAVRYRVLGRQTSADERGAGVVVLLWFWLWLSHGGAHRLVVGDVAIVPCHGPQVMGDGGGNDSRR